MTMIGETAEVKAPATRGRRSRRAASHLRPYVVPVLALVGFGLFWEAFSRFSPIEGISILVPSPSVVLKTLFEQMGPGDGERPSYLMLRHTGVTVFRLLTGYCIAAVISTMLGLLMGINRHVYEWCNPLIAFFMPIPSITLVPVAIIWFGLGTGTVIFIVVVGSCFPIIYNAAAGVQSTPQKHIWAAQIAGASKVQIFFKVLLPGAMPYLIAGQKLALGRAWRGVIAGEIFAATKYGLGFMIFDARTFLDTQSMFAGIIMVGILGLILERAIFRYIEGFTVERWGMATAKSI